MGRTLLSFYRKRNISPVRQDIRDRSRHFERREALYRHLGIPAAFVKARTVLEVGPGSGFNSLYVATLQPARYIVVEPNPAGAREMRSLFEEASQPSDAVEMVPIPIEHYKTAERFDLVLCEGVLNLSGHTNPTKLLTAVAKFVCRGGVLVITCTDPVSHFAETLRRLLAHLMVDPDHGLEAQVAALLPVFEPHLARLDGMSRRYDDWIIDNLINPATIGPTLSIPAAIRTLDKEFEVFGCSPKYLTDWRWYKTIFGVHRGFNEMAVAQYWQNVHNLLDHDHFTPARAERLNRHLYRLCSAVRNAIQLFESSRRVVHVKNAWCTLNSIVQAARGFSPETAAALEEVATFLSQRPIDRRAVGRSQRFGSLWGRGQQYLSFIRR